MFNFGKILIFVHFFQNRDHPRLLKDQSITHCIDISLISLVDGCIKILCFKTFSRWSTIPTFLTVNEKNTLPPTCLECCLRGIVLFFPFVSVSICNYYDLTNIAI